MYIQSLRIRQDYIIQDKGTGGRGLGIDVK